MVCLVFNVGIEMIFAKKIPKDDTSDPKRIKKDLLKNLKSIRDCAEHVVLIAATSKPWLVPLLTFRDADVKAMMSIFDKLIFCPKPDYASRMLIWKAQTGKYADDQARHLNYSLLTRISNGTTASSIQAICHRVLTERRLAKIRTFPLTTNEFVEQMLSIAENDTEEDQLFKEFSEKTPLAKKRGSLNAPPEEVEKQEKAPKKKGK
jgi:SpoVK/Ycf46/Vps4 family AAA+-type ATPase